MKNYIVTDESDDEGDEYHYRDGSIVVVEENSRE